MGGYTVWAYSSPGQAGLLSLRIFSVFQKWYSFTHSEVHKPFLRAFGYEINQQAKRHLGELLEVLQCYKKYGSKFSLMLFSANEETYPLGFLSPVLGVIHSLFSSRLNMLHASEVSPSARISNSAILNVVEVLSSCRLGLHRHFIADRHTLGSCSPIVT